jgi:hypothetical protein
MTEPLGEGARWQGGSLWIGAIVGPANDWADEETDA